MKNLCAQALVLLDTHSHLHVKEFDVDRAAVIKRAFSTGIRLINVGFEPKGNKAAQELAEKHEGIWWTAGIHPHHADQATEENLQWISRVALGKRKKLVALGEMGLDFYKNFQPAEVQVRALKNQLGLARQLKLPVIFHCRDAFAEAFQILKEEGNREVVFHCFTGGLSEAEYCWEQGFFTSFTGICTYPSAAEIRNIIVNAPLEKIMIETDCPFLPPQSMRGKRNEPSFLREIFRKICEMRNMSEDELENALYRNTRKFFNNDLS